MALWVRDRVGEEVKGMIQHSDRILPNTPRFATQSDSARSA